MSGGIAINRSNVRTYRYRVGKNHYLVIHIRQAAVGRAESGNVLASNAVNVQIARSVLGQHSRRRRRG